MKLQLPDTITPDQLAQICAILNAPILGGKETHICGVLDESASMGPCKASTIEAYNSFTDEIAINGDKGGKTYTSSLVFSSYGIRFISKHVPSYKGKLAHLTPITYRPQGGTPLYDAIDMAIRELQKYDVPGKDFSALVSIFTDGEENSSKITGPILSSKIRELQNTGRWTFTVAGANISLDDLADRLGFYANNMISYDYNPQGIRLMSSTTNSSAESYMKARGAGASASIDFYNTPQPTKEELEALMKAQMAPKVVVPSVDVV